MSDESAATTEATAEVTETAPVETANTEVTETEDNLPEWAREKLTKANNEAAKYRLKAKEAAEQAMAEAEKKYSEQVQALADEKAAAVAEVQNSQLALVKLRAALSVGIPGESATEFADLLKGDTEEEISSHAAKVKELFAASNKREPAIDPTQGRSSAVPLNGDPILDLVKNKLGI